jgi:hypothetical protein
LVDPGESQQGIFRGSIVNIEGRLGGARLWLAADRVLWAAILIICMAGFGLAQNTNSGDIRGTVTDASGAVIPGVSVTLLDVDTGVTKELVTNGAVLYDAVSILPGQYTITVSKAGFG